MRRRILATSATSLVLLTAACGGDAPEPSAEPTGTTSSSAAPSPDPQSSETDSPSAPTPTEQTVAPATGALITGPSSTVNAPASFRDNPSSTPLGGNVNGKSAEYNIALSDNEIELPDESTDFLARLVTKSSIIQPPLKRQPDTTMAGQPAYHLAGEDTLSGRWAEEYGLYADGYLTTLTISTPLDLPQAKRDAIAGPVLASFKLTG